MKQTISLVISQVPFMPCSPKGEFVDSLDLVDLLQPDEDMCIYDEDDAHTNVEWDYGEEQEKACSDRITDATKAVHRFSRVHEVDSNSGKILISKKYKPVQGSPSASMKRSPFTLAEAVSSTRRIRILFEDDEIKCQKMIYGTAFKVSKSMACSARHCFQQDGMILADIEMCQGSNVSSRKFDSAGCACELKIISTNHWSKTKDKDGLFVHGADVTFFTSTDRHMPFLIPCSPSFLSVAQGKSVAILSYPALHKMLQQAKEDLSQSGSTPTWKAYLPAMAKDLQEASKKLGGFKGDPKRLPKAVLSQLKKTLFEDLEETFAGFSPGSLLCAVGSLVSWNDVSLGSTCSTLRGSSGAALCVIGLPGYFIGIHSGGICGHDMNGATSTDNAEFVEMYITHVLPTLPGVSSKYWKSIDTKGFLHWLELHAGEIPQGSPWGKKALGRSRECSESASHPAKRRSSL